MARPLVTGYQGFCNFGQTAVIAQGDQESAVINCGGMVLAGIQVPNVFTGTALTFTVGDSVDGFQATGQIVLDTNPANSDTLTINGTTITFTTGTASGNQVKVAGTAALTAAALYAFLIASTDTGLIACTYENAGAVVIVTAIVHGTAGNAYTFSKSSSHITLTPSGGTLSGGGFQTLYTAANSAVSMTVAQGRTYAVDPANFQGVQFLKIKSGTSEVAQRTLICSLKGF